MVHANNLLATDANYVFNGDTLLKRECWNNLQMEEPMNDPHTTGDDTVKRMIEE